MYTILCYGDSHVWGAMPGVFDAKISLAGRFSKHKRWTTVLQNALGQSYDVVEDCLNGRTTTVDEITPGRPFRNGLTWLATSLEMRYPVDMVVLMLGTNDLKVQYNQSAQRITANIKQLIDVIRSSNKGPQGSAPKILLIAPPPILNISHLHFSFDHESVEKSRQLGKLYRILAEQEGHVFFDAADVVTSSTLDGFHMDESQLPLLGKAVAQLVVQSVADFSVQDKGFVSAYAG